MGFQVHHYIKADFSNNTLTTDDSITRLFDYDETSLEKALGYNKELHKRESFKRGWQKNDWACGHYVIAAIERDILGIEALKALEIDAAILNHHSNLYAKGEESIRIEKGKRYADEINIEFYDFNMDDDNIEKNNNKTISKRNLYPLTQQLLFAINNYYEDIKLQRIVTFKKDPEYKALLAQSRLLKVAASKLEEITNKSSDDEIQTALVNTVNILNTSDQELAILTERDPKQDPEYNSIILHEPTFIQTLHKDYQNKSVAYHLLKTIQKVSIAVATFPKIIGGLLQDIFSNNPNTMFTSPRKRLVNTIGMITEKVVLPADQALEDFKIEKKI